MKIPRIVIDARREFSAARNAVGETFFGTPEQYEALSEHQRAGLKYALVQNLGDEPETGGETYQGGDDGDAVTDPPFDDDVDGAYA